MNCKKVRTARGFTLVELLVVMAVIATLAAILFPAFGAIKKNAAKRKARAEMRGHLGMAYDSLLKDMIAPPPQGTAEQRP